MATKDFKVRNGLIVGGTLTLGGNVVSKVLDSDAVTAIAGSGSNVVHSIGGDSDQAFSKLDTQLNAAGTPVSIGDIAFVEGADSVAYVATGTPSVFTGSHSLTMSSTAPSGDQRIIINGLKISPLTAITAAANSNTTSNIRLTGAALTALNTAAAFPAGNAGAFCGWQPNLTLNIPGEGSARTSVHCLVLMTPNSVPTWDGAAYAFTATIAGIIPVSNTGSTTPTDIRNNFYSWTNTLTTTSISISQSGASYGLFPATLASSIAAQWTKISNNFDSDQIVTIINENTTAGSIDSDVAAIAQLRRDADSDSIRIQEIATSLEQINELVDSDLKAIADLRNDVDSDSIRIQDLQTQISSIGGLTDSDLKAVADLRNDVDSDSVKLQALQVSVDGLAGTALSVTRFTYKYGEDGNSVVGDSEITGADENGNTLSYVAGKIQVYTNGVLLEDSDDYVATDGSTITLRAAPDSDDVVSIFKYLGTTQSGFDSEQVVSIINENSSGGSGFDSDQVVAIIDENPSHPTISAASSVNNSGNTFIQDITLDSNGHITSLTSATATSSGGLGNYGTVNSTGTAASATGTDAISIGEDATANFNEAIAIGRDADAAATSAIAIGRLTTAATDGIAIGNYARVYGRSNIAIGSNVVTPGYTSDEGSVSIGYLINNGASAEGSGVARKNVYIGHNIAGNSTNNTGNNNIAIGQYTYYSASSGGDNVLLGQQTGYSLTTGSNNVAVGSYAGGSGLNTGSGNVYLGYGASALSGSSNEIVIGNGTGKGTGSGFITSTNTYNGQNSSSWQTTSDQRVKKNIADYTNGLDKLELINVKTFNYRSDSDIATNSPELAGSDGLVHEGLDTEKTDIGIIAQELELILPNTITTRDNGMKSVNKDELFWVMLNSIKELKARVEALENN